MAEYDIGGGKKIKVPDNLDPETRLQLAEVVKDKYGIDINQTTALGQVGEFAKAIPRGAAGLALDVPTGIVGLFDIGNDSNLYKGLEGLQDKLRQESPLAADPRYADKFSTKLGEGIGSFGPFFGAGLVGRALTKTPKSVFSKDYFKTPEFIAPAALAVPTGIAAQGDRLQMAREMGEDVSGLAETTAELFGGVIGLTEVAPIAAILGKVHKNAPLSTKERLVSALQSGAVEGGQEVAAGILQDLTARGLYSDELPIGESMFEEFTIGGIIGGAADLVVSSMAGKKAVRKKQMEEDNLRAEEKKEQLILAKKAELAQEQGTLDVVQDTQVVTVPQIPAPKEVAVEPQVEIIETPDNKFSLIDISNPDSPVVLDTKDKQTDAAIAKQKLLDNFDVAQLLNKLKNDTYNLGMINSATAYEIGQSILDTKAADIGIQQLINTVPDKSKSQVKLRGLVNSFVAQNPGKTSSSYPRIKMTDAKQLLTPKEFNDFASAYAQELFQFTEKQAKKENRQPSIIADKQQPNTSVKYVKDIAASKNIDLDFNSPAVQYAAEQYTGTADYKKMNKGQKELFLAKIHSLSPFNSRTTFPDFKPRDYSAEDTANFVAQMKSNNMTFNKKSLEKFGRGQQFLDDLIYSGRAEKVEGTNDYKIRDNFEFDIARRAEGFNETPQEFGARLTAQASENKLTPEGIAELVEKEKVRQERLLPPAEVIPKTINYAETLEEGKTNKFAKEVRKNLDKIGLKDTGIVISDDIISTTTLRKVGDKIKYDPRMLVDPKTGDKARGEYDSNTDTIFLSLNAVNPDGSATDIEIQQRLNKILDHEVIHALRAKDLITAKEYQYLKKQVEKQKVPNTNITFLKQAQGTYADIGQKTRTAAEATEFYYEEAIAELFRKKDLLVNNPPKTEGIFNKIIDFFKSMGQAMRSSGYKNAQDVFNDIESGRIGRRERGVIRSTRLGDRDLEQFMFGDRIPEDRPVPPRTEVPGEEVVSTLKPRGIRPLTIPKPKPTTPTPPAGPTTPPTTPITSPVPNKIYDSRQMSFIEKANERQFILDNLKKTGVFNPRSRAKGDSVKMMKWLKNNAPNQDYKIIATKVHQSLVALEKLGYDFPLEITQDKTKTKGFRGRVSYLRNNPDYFEMRINDMYGKDIADTIKDLEKLKPGAMGNPDFSVTNRPANQTIINYIENSNGVNFETLLHEGIHQATVAQMKLAGGAKSKNKKIAKAYKDLASQRTKVETYVRDIMSKFDEGATNIEAGNITFDEFLLSLPNTLNVSLKSELMNIYFINGNFRTKNEISNGLRSFEKNFIQYKINGIQSGNPQADSSEFLTFGLTNRNFQELLESIPTKPGATKSIWNEFVETIRNILGLPAKLNTELSAFLKNAGVVLDLQSEGVPLAGMDVGRRGIAEEVSLFSRGPRDESSGHVADYVLAQYGPPAHDLNAMPSEEFSPEGYSTFGANVDYNRLRDYSTARPQERAEEQRFLNKLKEIKGNPNATITMYQAAPSRDLREGDLITPFLSDAEALVEDSKVTQQEIRDADRARRRQEQIDKTGAVDLRQEQLYNQMDNIMDVFGAPQVTPSTVHTYELKAGDVRWDGNNGWARWGYFPSKVKDIGGDIPTFSREADNAYFAREKKNQRISNLESSIYYKEAQLNQERDRMTDATARRLEKEIQQQKNEIAELRAGDIPTFSRGQRFNDGTNSQKNIKLADALAEAEETVKQTPRGAIPFYNLNASDMALEVAIEFNKDLSAKTPEDIPTFSRPGYDGIDSDIAEASERLGGKYQPDRSWGARTIEAVKDPVTSINSFFKDFRQNFIDKLDKVDKKIMQASQDSEEVRYFNNTADTATMAALRLADRARGLFQGMLTRGYVSDVIEGNSALANVKDLELQNGETGGLIQILAPLFSNPEVNLEKVFKLYATLKRAESFDAQGKLVETPVKAEDYALIQRIEQQHPEVLEVYNNYQTWNNKLIDFAEKKGLLDPEQAELWRTHSSYYPFYRNMVDDAGISAPTIAGGSLPNNPLAIKIEGSEDIIDVDPIEAISRNSLSILTAALKNDGTAKLLRDLQSIGEARPVTPKQSSKLNTIFVFENGNKQFYEVDDVNLFHGIQGIGGVNTGTITKILAFPAGILRDTVTRDPGFVVINILRDTLSSAVTSGAPYTPVVDSVKNMFRDMENLEKFGVLGGYDFSNDEGSVKQFITRTMRQKGLTPENGMSASSAFFKVWDGLGALTTKSDGATRLAVYEGVYKKLKEEGYTEAQAQSEAAFQALEIINFGRRGLDPMFKVITAAIPFLNARVQGLDVLYRGLTGKYSSVEKLQEGETLQDVQSRIFRRAALRGGMLVTLTGLYYMMVSDSDEYKNLKREVRDDNWIIPIGDGNAVKIPIPFEVGMLFKAIPERLFDMTLGDDAFTRKSVDEVLTSTARQLKTSASIPFFQPGGGLQLLKPIAEVYNNKNTFTNTEIVPYYQQKKEAGLQSRATTNELAKVMGEFFNISPSKIEHVMRGYTGTLGGYVLTAIDTITRGATGSPLLPSNFQLSKMPVFNRLLLDLDKSGGYQQQFYELRNEVDKAVQTINSLKKQQRFDELSAYRSNMQGVLNVKGQVRAIDRYLANWRERRDRLMRNENISITVKSDMLRDLELERDMRLAMIPELRKKANIPVITMNL